MNCENISCIYQKDGKCTLDEVSMNSLGMCSDCIVFDISYEQREKLKLQTLLDIETRYNELPAGKDKCRL